MGKQEMPQMTIRWGLGNEQALMEYASSQLNWAASRSSVYGEEVLTEKQEN